MSVQNAYVCVLSLKTQLGTLRTYTYLLSEWKWMFCERENGVINNSPFRKIRLRATVAQCIMPVNAPLAPHWIWNRQWDNDCNSWRRPVECINGRSYFHTITVICLGYRTVDAASYHFLVDSMRLRCWFHVMCQLCWSHFIERPNDHFCAR